MIGAWNGEIPDWTVDRIVDLGQPLGWTLAVTYALAAGARVFVWRHQSVFELILPPRYDSKPLLAVGFEMVGAMDTPVDLTTVEDFDAASRHPDKWPRRRRTTWVRVMCEVDASVVASLIHLNRGAGVR